MAEHKLKIDARRDEILSCLRRNGTVKVSQLCRLLGVTPVTIRNDLDTLEREGNLIRVPGGAVLRSDSVRDPSIYRSGAASYPTEKQAVAAAVAELIRDGDTLFINSGTTTEYVAAALRGRQNLNIVTNAIRIALALRDNPSFHVILLGGEINAQHAFTCGCDAQEQLGRYQADWAILSVDGISPQSGITSCHAEETIIDRLMLERAEYAVVAADHSKIGCAGFSRICETSADIRLVTDSKADVAVLAALKERGLEVVLA